MLTNDKRIYQKEFADLQHPIKIMVADDDLPTRMLLKAAINQWGFDVVEAANGEEAWKILQENDPPMLLIIDWLMPKMDGIELSSRIKAQLKYHPYIILLTQVAGTSNIVKALEAGADEFLTKPFNITELHSRISVGAKIINYKNMLLEQTKKLAEVQQYSGGSFNDKKLLISQLEEIEELAKKCLKQISEKECESLKKLFTKINFIITDLKKGDQTKQG